MQALLHETRRLREENKVLRIQVSSLGPPRSQQPKSQRMNSRQNEETSYPGNVKFPFDEWERQPEERFPPVCQAPLDEGFDSTRVSAKRRCDRKSQQSNAMRARQGPQMPSVGKKPHVVMAQEACPGPSIAPVMIDCPPSPSAKTTTCGGFDKLRSPRLCQQTIGWHALYAF